jgi:hypothetical protein
MGGRSYLPDARRSGSSALVLSFTDTAPMTRSVRVATLEEAKARFQKSWDAWKVWANLTEID